MPTPTDVDAWTARVPLALARYAEPLLREVAARLVKPRVSLPADELAEKCVATLANPPVVDRRLHELPPASRKVLTLVGLSRRSSWKVGHLITTLATLGHSEGLPPLITLLEHGLLLPDLPANFDGEVSDFNEWLTSSGLLHARLFAPPAAAARARGEPLDLPPLAPLGVNPLGRFADGLDWPLRLALVWQQVAAAPVRLTQAHTLFKRDLQRLQADELLSEPTPDQPLSIPDAGVLALFWAEAAGLLIHEGGELRAGTIPPSWGTSLTPTLAELWGALTAVEPWDALAGTAPPETGLSSAATAGFLSVLALSTLPAGGWTTAAPVAAWLWDHHPSWQGTVPRDHAKSHGRAWVENYWLGVIYPLKLVEAAAVEGEWAVRLTDLGRHFLAGAPEPAPTPVAPQALLVQPNAEVLAYRQGLTPSLVGKLTRFAKWKTLGPACTLELNAERTYLGLESGLTLPAILQTLNQHGMKPVPATVSDLLRRWADKRDRITVYAAATLVEFQTPADLDAAIARGVVAVRVTDRIGLTDDGRDPEFKQLRLVGNRDYDAKPQRCVAVGDDGVTLTIDTTHADLLLEAEIVRLADAVPGDAPGVRRFRLTPTTVRRALAGGTLAELDTWFRQRAGQGTPPTVRLFAAPPDARADVRRHTVLHLADEELADGLAQWPETAERLRLRLGPKAFAVDEADLQGLTELLAGLGIECRGG